MEMLRGGRSSICFFGDGSIREHISVEKLCQNGDYRLFTKAHAPTALERLRMDGHVKLVQRLFIRQSHSFVSKHI